VSLPWDLFHSRGANTPERGKPQRSVKNLTVRAFTNLHTILFERERELENCPGEKMQE
jgi:hypothetical protein